MRRLVTMGLSVVMLFAMIATTNSLQAQWKGSSGPNYRVDESVYTVPRVEPKKTVSTNRPFFNSWGGETTETVVLTQDFELATWPPTGWSIVELAGTGTLTVRSTLASGYGVGAASALFDFYSVNVVNAEALMTPTFTATVAGDSLKFDHAGAPYSAAEHDSVYVESSIDGGTSWTILAAYDIQDPIGPGIATAAATTSEFVPNAGQWGTKTLALPIGTNRVRFIGVTQFGNNVHIDNIRVGTPPANDIQAFSFDDPLSGEAIPPNTTFTPLASYKNVGTADQSNVSVKYEINSVSNVYTSTKVVPSLLAGQTVQVTFDAATGGLPSGSYTLRLIVVTADQDATNDTLNGTLTVSPPMSGTYTIGGTTPDYASFTAAITDIQTRGISGAVTFNVRPGVYGTDAGTEADTILVLGAIQGASAVNTVSFVKESGTVVIERTGTAATNDYILLLNGADYVTFDGIDLAQRAGSDAVEFPLVVQNASATDGATYNTFKNFSITGNQLTNPNVGIGVLHSGSGATSAAGANSYNRFYNFAISGVGHGFQIVGTAAYPDVNVEVGTTGGGTSTISYGAGYFNAAVGFGNQDGIEIFNVEVTSGTQTGAVSLYGLAAPFAGAPNVSASIYNCVVHGLAHSGTGGNARAIHTSHPGNYYFYNNRVYDVTHTAVTSTFFVSGISIEGAGTAYIYNNFISDIKNPGGTGTTTPTLRGINLNGTSAVVTLYNNTVYLDATVTSTSRSSAALYVTVGPTSVDFRNNVLVNMSAAGSGTTNRQAAVFKSSTSFANLAATSNNNLVYAGTPTFNKRVLFYDANTANDSTLAQYKARMTPRETNSVTENPPFKNVAVAPYDLHIDSLIATQIEHGGQAVGLVTTDFDGQARDPSTPDIGADEGGFTPNDLAPPIISYVSLGNTTAGSQQTLSANISDSYSGVPTAGIGLPVLYWKINSGGSWTPATGTYVSGNQYDFTFGAGTVLGDTVFYYVVAQDAWATPNVVAQPSAGAGGYTANPPAASIPPTSPSFYRIRPSFSGTYTVGTTTGTYTTLKAAFDTLNASVLTGNVILEIQAEGTSEAATASLNALSYQGAPYYTVTIKPAAATTPTISGTITGAVVKLNGADYVVVDGSNSGGTTRDLTIANNSTAGSTAAIWVASTGVSGGSTNNLIKNMNLKCGANTATTTVTTVGILFSGATLSLTNDGEDNDNNTIMDNVITKVRYGIYLRGSATNSNDNNTITGNTVGPTAWDSTQIGKAGIILQYQNATSVTENTVQYVGGTFALTSGGTDRIGIGLGSDSWTPTATAVTNAVVTNNTIHHVIEERTFSSVGISVAGSGSPSNNLIANNMIYQVRANGTAGDQSVGIGIGAGNGDKVVYNTIVMTDSLDPLGPMATASVSSAGIRISSTTPTNLTLADNIISVNQFSRTVTLRHYAIVAPATSYAWGSGFANYNNYYAEPSNAQMAFGGIGTSVPYTVVPDLVAWRGQFTPNQDANSASTWVEFAGADDLHLAGGSRNDGDLRGTPIVGVTTDFDGDSRDATIPYMGADESTTFIPNPIADQGPFPEDFTSTFVVDLRDVFGISSSFSALSRNGIVNASIDGDTALYIAGNTNAVGGDQIVITADEGLFSLVDSFAVTVTNLNDAPIVSDPIDDIVIGSLSGSNFVTVLTSVFTDPDAGDNLGFSALTSDDSVDATISGDSLFVMSDPAFVGVVDVYVTATDDSLASVTDTFVVTVTTNAPPSAVNLLLPADATRLLVSAQAATSTTFRWSKATDPDLQAITYTWEMDTSASFGPTTWTQLSNNSGADTLLAVTNSGINAYVADLGVDVRDSIIVYWRISASDGVASTLSAQTFTMKVVRQLVTSAPDAWGYTYTRSTDPGGPTFNWIDITGIGTQVSGLTDDNNVGPYPIGFEFPYYWYGFSNFRVGSNGYITPGNQTSNFASPFAQLPNASAPNDIIAALAGDLVFTGQPGAAGQCYYWSNGVDTLIVSYIGVTEWETTINPASTHTFQIILSKLDTSITFQYGQQGGAFNSTNNTTLSIGVENQTGTIGLNYGFSSAPPHPFMPTNGLAVKIWRTVNTGLSVTDAGVVGGFNQDNIAKVVKINTPDTIKAVVKNYGTIALSNVRVTHQIVKSGQPAFRDTVFIASMAASEQIEVTFPRVFTAAASGSYSATFTTTVTGDQGPANNTKVAEILSLNLVPFTNTEMAFESGVSGGSINWSGGGGMGVQFESKDYPIRVNQARVNITSITANPMTVEILSDSSGYPGHALAARQVTAVTGWNTIDFTSDSVTIPSGTFYIGARGQMAFTYETTAPISYRAWEYTGGWAAYRSRDLQDILIRAVVNYRPPVGIGGDDELAPTAFALHQNYPNPFNPTTTITYDVKEQTRVVLKVYNVLGQEVRTLVDRMENAGARKTVVWDGKNNAGHSVSTGIYFYRIEMGKFVKSRKMMLMK